jgi:hypothetical protein
MAVHAAEPTGDAQSFYCILLSFGFMHDGGHMEIFAALAVLAALYLFFRKHSRGSKRTGKATTNTPSAISQVSSETHQWDDGGNFDFEVVGESHYQSNLRALAGDHGDEGVELECKALLVPDNLNKHDDKAVTVYVNGLQVGNLSREDARSFRRRLGRTTSCNALIRGGGFHNGEKYLYGIRLDMKLFE